MAEPVDSDVRNLEERLKSTLWFNIGKIVDSESINLGVNATPQFIGSLTELVWTQIESTAQDLESFARHGKRSTIQTEDVLLLARRNEGLESILRDFVDKRLSGGTEGPGQDADSDGEGGEAPGKKNRKMKMKKKKKESGKGHRKA